ncbi:MAG: T9SS type A sorting domain-containing protein [Ignavibacteria bacterium]|nr:T9SS type A sorting domain-containing protein [Ignavibacteria bacterium]
MINKYTFFSCIIFTTLLTQTLRAQVPNEILFGTYVASSPDISTLHEYWDTNLVKLGFNSIVQTVVHPVIYDSLRRADPVKWGDNRNSLAGSSFGNIVALNSLWNVSDQTEKQVDWVNILSQGVYNIWEAEGGSGGFESSFIKMYRNEVFSTKVVIEGDTLIKSAGDLWLQDTNSIENTNGIVLIQGPFIYQDKYYKFTHLLATPDKNHINYLAIFKLGIGHRPDTNITACKLRVFARYLNESNQIIDLKLAERIVKTDSLSSEGLTKIILEYNLSGIDDNFFIESGKNPEKLRIDVPASATIYYEVLIPSGTLPSQYGDLYLDNIEVMDRMVWYNYGSSSNRIKQLLTNYNETWQNGDTGNVYQDKIRYFYTMDEPHSYDHFLPYKKVEDVQRTLSNPLRDKMMLTKMYPEFSGNKEGLNVLDTWGKVVKPRKFMFWYFTIFKDDFETQLMQHQLRERLIEAVRHDRDFFFTAQTWGSKMLDRNDYHYYKTPGGVEILGQSIMSLAFGCKGIFYETYYTYKSSHKDWKDYIVEGLVGKDTLDYKTPRANDRGLYDMVGRIGQRLKGELGKTLFKLNYSDWSAYIYNMPRNHGAVQKGRDTYGGGINRVEIYDENELIYPSDKWYSFGVTRLTRKIPFHPYEDYYFFYNANTFSDGDPTEYSQYTDYLKVGLKSFPKKNIRFYNIEGGENYSFTRNLSGIYDTIFRLRINKGDGKLFRLIPVVASTGTLLTDEVIGNGEMITSEGTVRVPSGVTLKIEGSYTLRDSLIIEDGGVLRLEAGSTLTLDSSSSVYCAGNLYINGTAGNGVTINFIQPDESKPNSIYLGRESTGIIKYAEIKNGHTGLSALSGFDTLVIENCRFTNISNSAILLNGAGYDKPLIRHNTYTNCNYAVFASNLSTVVVNSDSANTRSGYCFTGVSDLWFGNNKVTGTQEGVGLTLTGCHGNIYNNSITGHTDGILLANSFPKIGGNEISNNTQRGLVCEYGSVPDLGQFIQAGECEQMYAYPLSGYNTIHDNGGEGTDEMNAEIYLDNSSIIMSGGMNALMDDGTVAIIAGKCPDDPLDLSGNYWGESGYENLTFNLNSSVTYQPEVTTYSPFVSTDCPFVINLSTLSFTDTLHRISNAVPEEGGERAERYMAAGMYDSAYTEYQQMSLTVTNDTTAVNTLPLRGMYRSGKLTSNKSEKLFLLNQKTDSLLGVAADTNVLKTLKKLKVYMEADNDNLPEAQSLASLNTAGTLTPEDRYHAQTEELTIALRGAAQNKAMKNDAGTVTTLNKEGMKSLMKRHGNRFTVRKEQKPVEVITEYSMMQNYPNPFNSSTVIEYALPKEGLVTITLYDIAGRLVKQLVNEQKAPGRYKTVIETGKLASGVYIYAMRVNDISINKKMVILK